MHQFTGIYGRETNLHPKVNYSSFEFEDIQSFQPPWKILQKCMGDDLILPCTSSESARFIKVMKISNKISPLTRNNVGFVPFGFINQVGKLLHQKKGRPLLKDIKIIKDQGLTSRILSLLLLPARPKIHTVPPQPPPVIFAPKSVATSVRESNIVCLTKVTR